MAPSIEYIVNNELVKEIVRGDAFIVKGRLPLWLLKFFHIVEVYDPKKVVGGINRITSSLQEQEKKSQDYHFLIVDNSPAMILVGNKYEKVKEVIGEDSNIKVSSDGHHTYKIGGLEVHPVEGTLEVRSGEFYRKMIKEELSPLGKVIETTGREAIELLSEHEGYFDIIFLATEVESIQEETIRTLKKEGVKIGNTPAETLLNYVINLNEIAGKEKRPKMKVVMMPYHGSIKLIPDYVIGVNRQDPTAYSYLRKPFDSRELLSFIPLEQKVSRKES